MKHAAAFAVIIAACATVLAPAIATPAAAGGWHRYGYDAPRYYNSPRAYRSACSYGDCVCLRNMAVSTGNPVWWDKYQACAG